MDGVKLLVKILYLKMGEEEYSINRIFDKRIVNNKVEYMVAFKDYHIGLSEWIPVDELKDCQDEIEYYEAKCKGKIPEDSIRRKRPSKFANDYDFILMKGKFPREHYKEYQIKDEFESDSDYEQLKIDYLEARKRMQLEEEREQLLRNYEISPEASPKIKTENGSRKRTKRRRRVHKKIVTHSSRRNTCDRESTIDDSQVECETSDKERVNKVSSSSGSSSSSEDSSSSESSDSSEIKKDNNTCKALNDKSSISGEDENMLSTNERNRKSRLRLDSSDSDVQMELTIDEEEEKVPHFSFGTPQITHDIDLENFLTFFDFYSEEDKKTVLFLTKDQQLFMIDENEIPPEMEVIYKDFLTKKGFLV
uniref:Chromo domain-containing protein n=2 Tax=Strongyloides stercoralis TaxID=6248 RepID=A0A0K0E398_STRER